MATGSQRSLATPTLALRYNKASSSALLFRQKIDTLSDSALTRSVDLVSETNEFGNRGEIKPYIETSDSLRYHTAQANDDGTRREILEGKLARMRSSPIESCDENSSQQTPQARAKTSSYPAPSFLSLMNEKTAPNRHDSGFESIMGYQDKDLKLDVDTQAGNIRARERLAIFRGRALRTRHILNDARLDVQNLRAKQRDSTAGLMGAIDGIMARGAVGDLQSLAPLHEETRRAQDELGPAEDALDMLEIRLNREEEELEEEEADFYTRNNITLNVPLSDSQLDMPLTPLLAPYQPDDIHTHNPKLDHELVRDYMEKLGIAERLKEEIDELESEQFSVIQELNFRMRHKLDLSDEKRNFMKEYPQLYQQLTNRLQSVEDDLKVVRNGCVEQGLFDASEYPYEPRDALAEDIYDSVYDAEDRLLPLKRAVVDTPTVQLHQTNFDDKRDFVNTWLLGWVQDSPVEALRLKAIIVLEYRKKGKILEGEEWPRLAVGWWASDKAGLQANEMHAESTMNAIRGETVTEGSLDVDLGDGWQWDEEIA